MVQGSSPCGPTKKEVPTGNGWDFRLPFGQWDATFAQDATLTDEGSVGLLRRLFLRAWNREQLGLRKTMSGARLAWLLTALGLKTRPDDVKNASRKSLRYEEGIVPRSTEVMAAFAQLQENFPEADLEKLLVPAELLLA